MKNYGLRVLVHASTFVEEKAVSEEIAVKQVNEMYNSGSLMGNLKENEYYDGMETDTEWAKDGNFGIRILVKFSMFVEIESNSEENAIAETKEMYYRGEIMPELKDNEYYDGMDIDVEY